jgi:hypothetical protein
VPVVPVKHQRPPVGTPTSEPFTCSKDAFDPLDDDELKAWGMA